MIKNSLEYETGQIIKGMEENGADNLRVPLWYNPPQKMYKGKYGLFANHMYVSNYRPPG